MPLPNANASIGAAEGAANAAYGNYSAQIRLKQAHDAALQQQARQQQQDRERQFDAEVKLRQDGYVPAEANSGGTIQSGGLGHRTPAPDATPQNTIRDAWNRSWYKPAKTDSGLTLNEALERGGQPLDKNGQVFLGNMPSQLPPGDIGGQAGSLLDRMNGASGIPSPGHVTPPDEQTVSTKGGGKYYIPTETQREQDKARVTAQNKEPKKPATRVDTEHFNQPVLINEDDGTVKPLAVPPGVTHNDKPSKFTYKTETNDAGRVTVHRISNEDGAVPEVWNGKQWAPFDAGNSYGPQRKDPNAQPGPKPATPAQLNAVENRKRVKLARAEATFRKSLKDALPDGKGGYSDPEGVQGALDDLNKAKQSAQDDYEQELSQFGVPVKHMEYSPAEEKPQQPAPQGKPAAATPQQAATQSSGAAPVKAPKQLTDKGVAKQYLDRAKGDKAKARALAKADGWNF